MINHVYTQDEQDVLYDLYIKLRHIEEKAHEISLLRDAIRDELTPNIMDGEFMLEMLDADIVQQIDYAESQLQVIIDTLHRAELG